VLFSQIFMMIGVMLLVLSLVLLGILLLISKASDKIQSSQGTQEYRYNFAEHQNYWEADK
jgi:hypothetical protein